jgi:hypothetical protein
MALTSAHRPSKLDFEERTLLARTWGSLAENLYFCPVISLPNDAQKGRDQDWDKYLCRSTPVLPAQLSNKFLLETAMGASRLSFPKW